MPTYEKLDPLVVVDASFGRFAPVEHCCCLCLRCTPKCGIKWALGVFIVEATWHIAISVLRPLWEWTSTGLTIFAFILQDVCRLVLISISISAWRGLNRGRDGAYHLRILLRGLAILLLMEVVEMALKFGEVHAVCNAPEVYEAHLRRAIKYNLTTYNATRAEHWCEIVSDVYDFGWGLVALLLLLYVLRIVHSYLRGLSGAPSDGGRAKTTPAATNQSEATRAADAELTSQHGGRA